MAKVKATGNKSTEAAVAAILRTANITGWRRHAKNIPGRPDFYFPRAKLILFVDGCFWHACPTCGRIPKTRTDFWQDKLDANRRRDQRTRRHLRTLGYRVFRVWEHEVDEPPWLGRLRRALLAQCRQTTVSIVEGRSVKAFRSGANSPPK
jgi:DNA mismatch endonuclease (patch repair protein)